MPTQIKNTDVKVTDTSFTVHGEGAKALRNSLVQKHDITISELSERFGAVHPTDISIGDDGTVHIQGAKLATMARRVIAQDGGFFDTNCGCGGGGSGSSSW